MNNDILDNKILEEVQNGVIPGMTYSVVKDNDIFHGSVGLKQIIPTKENTSEDTLYDLASLSKVVSTVTIVSKMYAEGKIKLNDKVSAYLERFKYDDVTIFDLLTHSSGLPADLDDLTIVSKEELLNKVYDASKVYETKTDVIYSDLGYILLGELISKVYGKPLDEVAREEVFIPLEMNHTCYNPIDKSNCAPTEETTSRGLLQGFVHDEKAFSLGGVAGNAGVFSTNTDLVNFMSMILNDGYYNGKEYLPKQIIDLWFKPLVFEERNDRYRSLCWIVGQNKLVNKNNGNVISFSGFTGPSISIDRDNNLGIALLTNRVHPTRKNNLIATERSKITESVYESFGLNQSERIM